MGYHRRYRRVFLDISNNIQPRAQTKWKVLKWYRDGRGCNILRILKSFDGKYHSIFNVSRIHRKLNNVLRNLFVRGRSHRSSASNFPHFYRLQYIITPNFFIFPKFKIYKNNITIRTKQFLIVAKNFNYLNKSKIIWNKHIPKIRTLAFLFFPIYLPIYLQYTLKNDQLLQNFSKTSPNASCPNKTREEKKENFEKETKNRMAL